MATYGILGGGSCPKNIIEDGLRELGVEGNTFYIIGTKKPSSNEERAFDFLLEAEADFLLVCQNPETCPKVLMSACVDVITSETPELTIVDVLSKNDGVLLVLWDEDNSEKMDNLVTVAADQGVIIKELSNGLIPIMVQDAPTTFSKEEFESMPTAIQKRNETSNPTVVASEVKITVPEPIEERTQLVAPDGDCMVTVVMPNGTVISTPATMEEVRVLLGLSGGS
jgi:hypothetical protein